MCSDLEDIRLNLTAFVLKHTVVFTLHVLVLLKQTLSFSMLVEVMLKLVAYPI